MTNTTYIQIKSHIHKKFYPYTNLSLHTPTHLYTNILHPPFLRIPCTHEYRGYGGRGGGGYLYIGGLVYVGISLYMGRIFCVYAILFVYMLYLSLLCEVNCLCVKYFVYMLNYLYICGIILYINKYNCIYVE